MSRDVSWVDAETSFECRIVWNYWGHWCAYVSVPATHPLYGTFYDDLPRDIFGCVCGGVTYSRQDENGWWRFGIDTAARPVPQTEEFIRGELEKLVRMLGRREAT